MGRRRRFRSLGSLGHFSRLGVSWPSTFTSHFWSGEATVGDRPSFGLARGGKSAWRFACRSVVARSVWYLERIITLELVMHCFSDSRKCDSFEQFFQFLLTSF